MNYELNEKEIKWCDDYLRARYVGVTTEDYMQGNFENRCNLYFKDINNFVQNAGRYSDLMILKICEHGDVETFFNTSGTFVNQIWPELSYDMRSCWNVQAEINYMAKRVGDSREQEGLYPTPLPKVNKYLKVQFGEEIMKQNLEFMEEAQKEMVLEQTESAMSMHM